MNAILLVHPQMVFFFLFGNTLFHRDTRDTNKQVLLWAN